MKLTAFLFLLSLSAFAQEEKKVMEPINTLFDAMKKGDSAMAHKVFHPQAKLFTAYTDPKTNQPALRSDGIQKLIAAIGTPRKEPSTELIWSPKIEIDNNLAQVWVPYALYTGKTFSHCGVDAFQLFKDASGTWKIFHVADTRQKEGCVIPKEMSDQMK